MKDNAEQWEELQQQTKADKQARQEHWQTLHREVNNMMTTPEQTAAESAEKAMRRVLNNALGGRKGMHYRELVHDDEIQAEIEHDVAKTISEALNLPELLKAKERCEELESGNGPHYAAFTRALREERDTLRAKVQELERQTAMYREQIRVADEAFNFLQGRFNSTDQERERYHGELLGLIEYCEGDICHNALDIRNIHARLKAALKPATAIDNARKEQ